MSTGLLLAAMVYPGTVQLNDQFGFFQAGSLVQIQRLQLAAYLPPIGGDVTVELTDEDGVSLGASVTLMASFRDKDQPLAAPVTLQPGDIVKAKITQIDAGIAQYLTLNLFGATAQWPSGPCCCGPTPNYYWNNGCGC